MKYGLSEEQLEQVKTIIAEHKEIEEAILFGSRAIDTYKEASDVDIAVKGEKVNLTTAAKLKSELEDETYIPFFFDIIVYNTIKQEELIKHIDAKGIVIYDRSLSEWKELSLGEVVTFQRGFDITKNEQILGEYPVVSSSGIKSYHSAYKVLGPGVVIGRKGTLGTVFYLRENFWPHDTTLWIRNFHDNYPLFIYYYLQVFDFGYYDVGSSNPTLNRNHIHALPSKVPPINEQKAIASVLSSFDNKIDLLHRQNKTLEAMAETLFRQRFITAPKEDWEEKPLDKIADYLNGLACQKYPAKNDVDKLPVLKIKELRNGFTENSDWASTEIADEYIIHNGDVIFSWSGSLMVKIWDGERCIINQHLFKVTSNDYPKWFYYFWTKHHLEEFISIAESKSTTMGHIRRGDLSNSIVIVPDTKELKEMDEIASPIIDKIIINSKQIRTLEKLRDTLLPKLMSGEVRCTESVEVRGKH